MAIQKIDKEKCIGCQRCLKSCPADVFRYDKAERKVTVQYPQDCQLCLWCITECPQNAVILTNVPVKASYTCWG